MGGHVNATWTDEQSGLLIALLAQGKSFSQIAAALNEQFNTSYSRNAVCGKGYRLQVKAPPRAKAAPKKQTRYRVARAAASVKPLTRASIEIRCAEIEPLHLTLDQLGDEHCRYPYGDGPFTFCGHHAKDSYCAMHDRLCHDKAPKVSALEVLRRRMHWKKVQGLATIFPLEAAE